MLTWINKKVKRHGAQYYTFAILNLLNHPIALVYDLNRHENMIIINIRILACILSVVFLFKNRFPKAMKKYLSVIWYIFIIVSVPTITTSLLISNNFTLEYLINFNIGVMLVLLLVDWQSFLLIQLSGISLGVLLMSNNLSEVQFYDSEHTNLFIYMFVCIVVLNSILTRNREIFLSLLNANNKKHKRLLKTQIKERTKDLERALAAKTEFLNNISHEIRTPVQGFTAISEGLVDNWMQYDDIKKQYLVKTISQNAKRLSFMLGSILDLAKYNKDIIVLEYSRFILEHLIRDLIEEAQTLYVQGKSIIFNFNMVDNIEIFADYERICQLLRNIIVNAIRYQTHGSITIYAYKKNKYVYISVSDQGVGIPDNELNSIFQSFVQSSRTKNNAGGTGLGLAIAQEIVRAHQGRIWAENNRNVGSTFNIVLPLSKFSIQDQNHTSVFKIVMIDDETSCLISMEMILGKIHNLITFENPYLALEYLEECKDIKCVLLDLMMPELDGIAILRIIKTKWPYIKVVIQSGTSDQNLIDNAILVGADGFISKPYDKNDIFTVINAIM